MEPLTTPDEGYELCTECDGARSCWSCFGKGKRANGQPCGECLGQGRCIICSGDGQLVAGTTGGKT